MDITRDAAEDAETFGFAAYLLAVDGDAAAAPASLADLIAHMRRSGANAIVCYEDPATAIARHLQSGQPLPKTLAAWKAMAQDYLAPCRKSGRRIALCRAAHDAAGADSLNAQLSQRFAKTTFPKLTPTGATPDAFFIALASLATEHDSAIRDLIHEFQARSIDPSETPSDASDSLVTLLSRWSERHDLFSGQILEANGQVATLRQTVTTLTQERDTARRAEQTQGEAATRLNHQIDALEVALQASVGDIEKLKAAQKSSLEAHEKQTTEHTIHMTSLTHERDAARKGEQEHSEIANLLNRQVSELEAVLQTTGGDVAKLKAEQKSNLEAHQKQTAERDTRIAALSKERDTARIQLEALHSDHKAQLDILNARIDAKTQNVTTLIKERDTARVRIEALQSDHKTQVEAFESRIDEQTHRFDELQGQHTTVQAQIEALHSDHKAQVEALDSRIDEQTLRFDDLQGRHTTAQAQIEALHSDHKAQLDILNARIAAETQNVTALIKEQELARTQISDAAQIETMLGQQVGELKQALVTTDARLRVVETEKNNLQQSLGIETTDMEQILQDTRHMLATVRGDWQQKLGSRDTLKQHVRQFEAALEMMEKRRADARHNSEQITQELQTENERLQSQLEAVYASTSWRITTPMRSIKRLVRK